MAAAVHIVVVGSAVACAAAPARPAKSTRMPPVQADVQQEIDTGRLLPEAELTVDDEEDCSTCTDCATGNPCGNCTPGWGVLGVIPNAMFEARDAAAMRYWSMREPMRGTSWTNRPLHADWFFGGIFGDTLIDGRVDQQAGPFGGFRFGMDIEPDWGWESRIGFAAVDLNYLEEIGAAPTGDIALWDINLTYYPWGDARWRPYCSIGLGLANVYAQDDLGIIHDDTMVGMPIGIGMKYYHRTWMALRVDLTDNIAFGTGDLDTMHNISLTAGMELRFGGSRPSFWPWNPSYHSW